MRDFTLELCMRTAMRMKIQSAVRMLVSPPFQTAFTARYPVAVAVPASVLALALLCDRIKEIRRRRYQSLARVRPEALLLCTHAARRDSSGERSNACCPTSDPIMIAREQGQKACTVYGTQDPKPITGSCVPAIVVLRPRSHESKAARTAHIL